MSAMSDSELRDKTSVLRERAQLGESLDTLLPEAFSVAREASWRVLGLRPFDVQLIGNIVLHKGEIAEMTQLSVEELVLRGFNYCVIDEVDSILIAEARTPLIISRVDEKPSDRYYKAAKIVTAFECDIHYTVDEKQKTVLLTEQGYEDTRIILDVKDSYDPREQWTLFILNAIKANQPFVRDVNYVNWGKEVGLVNEY